LSEHNIKYSFMHHWRPMPYARLPKADFRRYYYEEKANYAYYNAWDMILKYYVSLGYEGIESFANRQEMEALFGSVPAFVEFIESYGLKYSGMFCGMGPGHIKANIPDCVKDVAKVIDTVVEVHGEHLNICPGADWCDGGPLDEDGIINTIDCLNEMGRYAADRGIKLGIHNEFFCIMNLPNHRRIIESTDPKLVQYCLDTAQVSIMGEDLLTFYEDYHDRICTFHMKDTEYMKLPDEKRYAPSNPELQDDGHRWFWEPGYGELDFEGLFKLLKKYNFKGWATVETDGTPDMLASMALASYFFNTEMAKIYR